MNGYELIIIGGGPAGVSAGVYAARKQLKTLLIAEEIGGQSIVSPNIQNWIGTPSISGIKLSQQFNNHIKEYAGDNLDIKKGERVESIEKSGDIFEVKTNKGETFETKTIFIGTGSDRRKIDIPGAAQLEHKGLTYCASCDGPFFAKKDVVVIGGGNAGFETASQLLAYTKSVTLLQRSGKYRADEITTEKVLSYPNMKGILNATPKKILGETSVTGIIYEDSISKEEHTLQIQGVFVEIGLIPNTSFIKSTGIEMDKINRMVVDPRNQRTSISGIWAAGDCTDALYHQNNIASGDAVKALENIYSYIRG